MIARWLLLGCCLFAALPAGSGEEKTPPKQEAAKESTVYVTKSGGKYHADGCQYLKSLEQSLTRV